MQKEIRKFERAKTAAANKAIKAAKSIAYQAKQAASKATKSGPMQSKKVPKKAPSKAKAKQAVSVPTGLLRVEELERVTTSGRVRRKPARFED